MPKVAQQVRGRDRTRYRATCTTPAASLPEGVWVWGMRSRERLASLSLPPLSRPGGSPRRAPEASQLPCKGYPWSLKQVGRVGMTSCSSAPLSIGQACDQQLAGKIHSPPLSVASRSPEGQDGEMSLLRWSGPYAPTCSCLPQTGVGRAMPVMRMAVQQGRLCTFA